MLSEGLETKNSQQEIGVITYKLVVDGDYRQQVQQVVASLDVKPLTSSHDGKNQNQLAKNVKSFLEVEPLPNMAPSNFWGP